MIFYFQMLQSEVVTNTLATAQTMAQTQVAITEEVTYLDFLLKGGAMIYPLIFLLFFCIYIIVERFLTIRKMTKEVPTLVHDIRQQLQQGKIENALMLCSRENTSSGNILRSGVTLIGRPISEIESAMERTTNIEVSKMEKNLGYLGLISGIAPILGFIGTIAGVIKIFHAIANTGNLNIQTISGGLYEKMISSGAGLVVGVVAYAAYHLYNMMIDSYTTQVQKECHDVLNVIQGPDGN